MSFAFFIIIGTRFFSWGSESTQFPIRCQKCGTTAPFAVKNGMQFITIFFIIPLIPISGIKHLVQCPGCKTRYSMPDTVANQSMPGPQGGGFQGPY